MLRGGTTLVAATVSCAATVGGIYYYSWSGTGVLTNALDISDPVLGLSSFFYTESNDEEKRRNDKEEAEVGEVLAEVRRTR